MSESALSGGGDVVGGVVGPSVLRLPLGELPDPLLIPVIERAAGSAGLDVEVRPPGSKSLTNRALLLAGLAEGESVLRHALTDADDAQRMMGALRQLGAGVEVEGARVGVRGVGGRWRTGGRGAELFLNNAGTATRFLAAAALVADGPVTIDGNARMRQRPIGELVSALEELGAGVEELGQGGCPPLRISPPPESGLRGAEVSFGRTQSSQFISALLLVGVAMPEGLTARLGDEITSASYVGMTVALLDRVGARVRTADGLSVVQVLPGLRGFELEIEPDASGATYFWAAAAITPGATVRVPGLAGSMQGDAGFPWVLERMGARAWEEKGRLVVRGREEARPVHGAMVDMSDMPDAAVTLAVVAAFADRRSVIRGVRTLRVKETDRIEALRRELAKVGALVEADAAGDPDTMTVTPPGVPLEQQREPVEFETYDDHRMAMALGLIGLRRPGVWLKDPGCVRKTYANYYTDLAGFFS